MQLLVGLGEMKSLLGMYGVMQAVSNECRQRGKRILITSKGMLGIFLCPNKRLHQCERGQWEKPSMFDRRRALAPLGAKKQRHVGRLTHVEPPKQDIVRHGERP